MTKYFLKNKKARILLIIEIRERFKKKIDSVFAQWKERAEFGTNYMKSGICFKPFSLYL